jgi:hypothetical protein
MSYLRGREMREVLMESPKQKDKSDLYANIVHASAQLVDHGTDKGY